MNKKIELQVLSTGHLAPGGDNDIAHNNQTTGKFPHAEIVTIPQLTSLPAGSVVIDVGAFIGDNTLEFFKRGWEVIAFEPFFDAFVCAKINAPRAITMNSPVGNGEKVVLTNDCPGTNHGMRSVTLSEDGIPTVRLDSLDLDKCAFIKIDAEGFEPFVLDGARDLIARCRPLMHIEANEEALNRYGWTINRLADHIRSFGYDLEVLGEPPRWDWICTPVSK